MMGKFHGWWLILGLGLLAATVGTGCARFRFEPAECQRLEDIRPSAELEAAEGKPDEAEEEAPDREHEADDAVERGSGEADRAEEASDSEGAADVAGEEPEETEMTRDRPPRGWRRRNNHNGSGHTNRFVLDPDAVLAAQRQALEGQQADYDGVDPWGETRFTRWLDRTHEALFCRLDNAVRRLDTMWLPEGADYDYKVSTFRVRFLTRVGGRGIEGDYNVKVRVNTRLALPGLQRELYLFVDNTGRDDLPGSDPLQQESDTRIGLRSVREFARQIKVDIDGGFRFRSSRPVFYAETRLNKKWAPGEWGIRLTPSVFYYSDDGFGQMTSLTCTRPLGENWALQLRTVERSTEATHGFEFEQTARLARFRSGRKRGWVIQGSLFPHGKSSQIYWDNAILNVTWRDALYKKWVFYTVTTQLDFAKEDDYEPRGSLRVGMEILFGGQMGDLM